MKIPQHIIDKVIAINRAANTIKNKQSEVIRWFDKNGYDISTFQDGYSFIEMAEYGELPNLESSEVSELIKQNIATLKDKSF